MDNEYIEHPAPVEESPEQKLTFTGKVKAFVSKAVRFVKGLPLKVSIPAGIGILVVIIGIPLLIGALTNNYKTPLTLQSSFYSKKEQPDFFKDCSKLLNGFCEKEYTAFLKILKKSDDYDTLAESYADKWAERSETWEDEYGGNYKYSYKILDTCELDEDELKEFKDILKSYASYIDNFLEETDDFDSDDWKDFADELGLTKSQAKDLVKAIEKIYKVLKNAKVTKGYELTCTSYIGGEEYVEDISICVYKVNGRWIDFNSFYYPLILIQTVTTII